MSRPSAQKQLADIEEREWSAIKYGDVRFGGLGNYGYACCPTCHGIKPESGALNCWPVERLGHQQGCTLMHDIELYRDRVARPRKWFFRMSFNLGGMKVPKRDGQYRYTFSYETDSTRSELLLTRAELEDLRGQVDRFLELDGVE